METQTNPAAASLYSEVAIDQVISRLMRLPDPDQVLERLGLRRHELRKLEGDDEISAALETRREAVVTTPWRLEPYDGEATEWLWETLAPHVETLVRGAWSALPYGFAVQEVIYRRGPRIGIEAIIEKPIEWFEPRRDGSLWYQGATGSALVEVDTRAKFLLTRRNPTYRNPFGEALLSRLYWPWYFRHNGWRFWMRFLERFADPLLLGQVFEPQAFVTTMQRLGLEAVVGVGREESVSAVTQAVAGEFERAEMALSRRIQKLILGQTLTSEIGDKGSYAAAQVHNEVREDKRRADIRLVSGTMAHLIDALWGLNRLPGEPPAFVMHDDTGLEQKRAERDAKLVEAGVLRLTEKYLLDRYDFEPGDFEVPKNAAPSPAALAMGQAAHSARPGHDNAATAQPGAFLAARRAQRFTPDQQAVEDLVAAALDQAASPIPAGTLRAAILAAKDPDDLVERLARLYGGEDATAFQEVVERALFSADVLGYVNAESRTGGG